MGPQQIITTTHGCGGHKAAAWRELLLKVKKKSPDTLTPGPVLMPSRCAQEGSVRRRVQCLGYESRARVRNQQRGQLGERAIESVWSKMAAAGWLCDLLKIEINPGAVLRVNSYPASRVQL